MHEITRWDERNEWLATRERIGFIGSSDTVALQNDIWTMELYQKHVIQMSLGSYVILKMSARF